MNNRFDKVPHARKKAIFAYNAALAADSAEADDMRTIAAAIGKLPPGQLKKILTDDIRAILSRYGVEV